MWQFEMLLDTCITAAVLRMLNKQHVEGRRRKSEKWDNEKENLEKLSSLHIECWLEIGI